MSDHYRLSNETTVSNDGEVLSRIIATRDLPMFGVKAGDKGGWLGPRAILKHEAWISDDASVYGCAGVYGNAHISGHARVYGHSHVSGYARIGDQAKLRGAASICGDAVLAGQAVMTDTSMASAYAYVGERAKLCGDAYATDACMILGTAKVSGSANVGSRAMVLGNATISSDRDVLTVGPVGPEDKHATLARAGTGYVIDLGQEFNTVTVDELSDVIREASLEWNGDNEEIRQWLDEYAAIEKLFRIRISGWSS